MLDKKTLKAKLLACETNYAKQMINELVWGRYEKLIKMIANNQNISLDFLAAEEAKIYEGFLPFAETYRRFAKNLMHSQLVSMDSSKAGKRVVLRILNNIPAVVGLDMKTYGPFKVEDVASLPVENARVLSKQGLGELIEFA